MAKLGELRLHVDTDTSLQAWDRTTHLAELLSLTIYDASYLELAVRLVLPLATRDKQLSLAASLLKLPIC